jgi:hypothetical protein
MKIPNSIVHYGHFAGIDPGAGRRWPHRCRDPRPAINGIIPPSG